MLDCFQCHLCSAVELCHEVFPCFCGFSERKRKRHEVFYSVSSISVFNVDSVAAGPKVKSQVFQLQITSHNNKLCAG